MLRLIEDSYRVDCSDGGENNNKDHNQKLKSNVFLISIMVTFIKKIISCVFDLRTELSLLKNLMWLI